MEDGLRLLIALFDSAQAKQPPRQDDFWGAASLATYSCAFYCEMALKTIIVGLRPDLVSVLARVPPWFSKKNLPPELRTHNLRKLYDEAAGLLPASEQILGESALEFARDGGGHMPVEWIPESVEDVLATDSTSFVDWRYGLAEGDDDIVGSPKSLFALGKGLTLFANALFESKFHDAARRSVGTTSTPLQTTKRRPGHDGAD